MAKSDVSLTQKILNIWAIVLIAWSFYRVTFKSDLPIWFDEFIAKPLVFLFPLYLYITRTEKKSFLKGIGFSKKNLYADVALGGIIGFLFIAVAFLARIIKGLPFPTFPISPESIIWILSTFMAAAIEQILSTGFVFKRLSEESKNIFRPFLISAILFFFLHIPVLFGADKISGSTLVQMLILNTIISITTSVVFTMRKNIISPIIVYALYLLSLPILL